jgi:predicted TIM-barrel fold metal-dependent hydrolase
MHITDAQVHIWSSGTPSQDHRAVPVVTAEETIAAMDQAGVAAAIIHPPGWDPNADAVAAAAVRRWPDRFAILGSLPGGDPTQADRIATWRAQPGMLGLRWAPLHPAARALFLSGAMDWIWPEAERHGVPVALLAGPVLGKFFEVAERHPGLRLIVDHCGLARLPNVAIKATGAPGYSTWAYPYRNLHDPLRRIYDAFGPLRFFWGTDITRMPCSWRQCVTMFTEELDWIAPADLPWVMGGGIRAWLDWPVTSR